MTTENFGFDFDSSDLSVVKGEEEATYPIFRLGGDLDTLFARLDAEKPEVAARLRAEGKTREDNTIYAGEVVGGRFLGTVPMFSLEFKENWEEMIVEGKKVYTNQHYAFERKDGSRFGIHDSRATLWVLEKIATKATNPTLENPIVKISYVGIVTGKDRLEKDYGVVLKTGNQAHVCTVETDKTAVIDRYAAGAINLLRNPMPNLGKKEKLSHFEQNKLNYEKAQERLMSQPAIDGGSAAQLPM